MSPRSNRCLPTGSMILPRGHCIKSEEQTGFCHPDRRLHLTTDC